METFFNLKAEIFSNEASVKYLHRRRYIHTEFVNRHKIGQEIFNAVVTKRKREVKDSLSIRKVHREMGNAESKTKFQRKE